jgi:hypothetical protein
MLPFWQEVGGKGPMVRPIRVTRVTTPASAARYRRSRLAGERRVCGPAEGPVPSRPNPRRGTMLWTIFVILLVLWLLGVVTSYTLGGFIHVLLIVAVILAIMQLISGRRAV